MIYKLGKLPPVDDGKIFSLKKILKVPSELPPIPDKYTFTSRNPLDFSDPLGNLEWGCCVRTGIAYQTVAFEDDEQNIALHPTEAENLKKYWNEQGWRCFMKKPVPGGKYDQGLVVLYALKDARKNGWKIGGKAYKIHAFANTTPYNHQLVKAGCFLLNGMLFGLDLPLTAQDQIGKVWEYLPDTAGNEPRSWGGHLVWNKDYPDGDPVVQTWGAPQEMTWEFLEHYSSPSEVFAVVDNKDSKSSVLDEKRLDSYLQAIS